MAASPCRGVATARPAASGKALPEDRAVTEVSLAFRGLEGCVSPSLAEILAGRANMGTDQSKL